MHTDHTYPTVNATRTAGLARLRRFVPIAGRAYALERNYDLPQDAHSNVSQLSPYLRHRLLTEAEVVEAVLARHSYSAAEKFVQEVFWRTYWKGWLEMRPGVWGAYLNGVQKALKQVDLSAELATALRRAEAGETDIDAFNAWARELTETGYLHNHARMWFASIWIFTLRLPWQLGADFFMRHLLDGDPASNTLSWRWVAGLQTQGKHYVARSSNIAKYTKGRHNPEWRLNTQAEPLTGSPHPAPRPLPEPDVPDQTSRSAVLLHDDDVAPGGIFEMLGGPALGLAGVVGVAGRSPRGVAHPASAFAHDAVGDACARWAGRADTAGPITSDVSALSAWAAGLRVEQVVTPYAPVGPTATALRTLEAALSEAGIALVRVQKPWDTRAWPHATRGYYKFKSAIPDLIDAAR